MAHWVAKCSELLAPIYLKMKQQVLESGYVLSDDTSLQVLDKNIRKKSHKGYIWTYGNLEQVVYDYTTGRNREGPNNFLKNYKGYLQTDGYAAYNDLSSSKDIVQLGCWAHARRKFFELKDVEPQLTEYPLDVIGEMYKVEKNFGSGVISFEERKTKAEELQKSFEKWLKKTYPTLLPASSIAKACKYSLNQWDKLTQYHKNESLQIDNNFSERCIKSVVIG